MTNLTIHPEEQKALISADIVIQGLAVEIAGKETAKKGRNMAKSFFAHLAGIALENPVSLVSVACREAADKMIDLVRQAINQQAKAVVFNGVTVELKRGKKGFAPASKQAPCMRLSDLAGRFARLERVEDVKDKILLTDSEAPVLRGENAFTLALSSAIEELERAQLSPMRRLVDDVSRAIKAQETVSKERIEAESAVMALKAAEASSLEMLATAQAVLASAEAAALASVNAAGQFDPATIKQAERKAAEAEAARKQAEAAKAEAEAAKQAAEKAALDKAQLIADLQARLAALQPAEEQKQVGKKK